MIPPRPKSHNAFTHAPQLGDNGLRQNAFKCNHTQTALYICYTIKTASAVEKTTATLEIESVLIFQQSIFLLLRENPNGLKNFTSLIN